MKLLVRSFLIITLTVFSVSPLAEEVWQGVERIVAVGDLHGDYDQYITVLKNNGLIDEKLKWAGGKTHFVQLGDIPDRGPDSMKIIQHIQKLEKQAKRAGGKVHPLIGNHEAMNITTDLRYVHPGEYQALVTRGSERAQSKYLAIVFRAMADKDPEVVQTESDVMAKLKRYFPLGYVEHRRLWEPGQSIARWVASHNTVIKINDSLFLHGGLNPHKEEYLPLETINETISKELSVKGIGPMTHDETGPLWYRGLAHNPAEKELEPLKRMLEHYGVNRIVVAHSTTKGAVVPRFERRVILVDVGISAHYGGSMANLVIEGDALYANHRGSLIALPEGDDLDAYLDEVVSLEPAGSKLSNYVKSGEQLVRTAAESSE